MFYNEQPKMDKGKGKAGDAVMADMPVAPTNQRSKYVTLISSDGFEFVVLRQAALLSGAIRRMLGEERSTSTCTMLSLFFIHLTDSFVFV